MKNMLIFLASFLIANVASAQTAVMSAKNGTANYELNQVLSFENINIESLIFRGDDLKGKYYQVFVKEYKAGKLIKTETLFDGGELDIFKIPNDSTSFGFFSKPDGDKLKIQIKSLHFSSRMLTYKINANSSTYVLKDFLGAEPQMNVPIGKPFYALAIITPTIHKDGSSSYCEVAQSNVDPESFWTKFNVTHYFLIEIVFK